MNDHILASESFRMRNLLILTFACTIAAADLASRLSSDSSVAVSLGSQLLSPNRQYVAEFYAVAGGGAAGWMGQYVDVRFPEGESSPEAFVVEFTHAYEVCLRWDGEEKLIIGYPSGATVVSRRSRGSVPGPIAIELEELPGGGGKIAEMTCNGKLAKLNGWKTPPSVNPK